MTKLRSTAGRILVNDLLPVDLRDYSRVLNKKTLAVLLRQVAEKYPDNYREISFNLGRLGHRAAYTSGGNSFGLKDMRQADIAVIRRGELRKKLNGVLADDSLTDKQRDAKIIKLVGRMMDKQQDEIFDESKLKGNPLADQLEGAGRGNKQSLASLIGSDGLYQDHRGNIIPVPVLKSYSQGLSPAEYWASTYGSRSGLVAVKFSTQRAGYLSKILGQASHRGVVTATDSDGNERDSLVGLPVSVDDNDSEGALLARETAGYPRNTVLTPKILKAIRKKGTKRILVRSPAVTGAPDGGLYARDVGYREFGRLPRRGEVVGLTASQALSEPLSQAQLSSKHGGGIAGSDKAVSGFDYIQAMVQVPKTLKGGASHTTEDGMVEAIEPAAAGGYNVTVAGKQHYVADGYALKVKKGQMVEAGDVLSEGIPNPAIVTKYKGIGEGRRYFIDLFGDAMRSAGIRSNRRNVELLSRGLINHVRLTDETGDYAPDDIVPYSSLAASYQPRKGYTAMEPKAAMGRYLERPYLHHSIGTKVRPSMIKDFEEFGIPSVDVHQDPPPFEPEMVRGSANLQHDPDWLTRQFGSGLKGSLLKGVHRGATADEAGTSFVAARAKAINFGRVGPIRTPGGNDEP